jgi:hypothetical protein
MPESLDSLIGSTIAVPAEIPQAIVLTDSFLRFHPQGEFATLVLDQPQPKHAELFPRGKRLLYPAEFALNVGEVFFSFPRHDRRDNPPPANRARCERSVSLLEDRVESSKHGSSHPTKRACRRLHTHQITK